MRKFSRTGVMRKALIYSEMWPSPELRANGGKEGAESSCMPCRMSPIVTENSVAEGATDA